MSSEKQIAANRANAQKSTGPTSEAGLERVSRNATRHGLLARTMVLDRENQDRFLLLLASLQEEFEPGTVHECNLVENMAVARWRLMRLWSIEKSSFDSEMRKQQSVSVPDEAAADSEVARAVEAGALAAMAFRNLADETRTLDLLARYEVTFDRLYARSLDRLMKIREKRLGNVGA